MRPADTTPAFVSSAKPGKSAASETLCKGPVDPSVGTAAFSDSLHERAPSVESLAAFSPGYYHRALLLDPDAAHAERLIAQVLQPQSVGVEHVRNLDEAILKLRRGTPYYALVIINVSANGPPWRRTLQKLQHACQRVSGQSPSLFLCVSETLKETDFILRIEQMGARYAYEH